MKACTSGIRIAVAAFSVFVAAAATASAGGYSTYYDYDIFGRPVGVHCRAWAWCHGGQIVCTSYSTGAMGGLRCGYDWQDESYVHCYGTDVNGDFAEYTQPCG